MEIYTVYWDGVSGFGCILGMGITLPLGLPALRIDIELQG
jgi:hypothetical protein